MNSILECKAALIAQLSEKKADWLEARLSHIAGDDDVENGLLNASVEARRVCGDDVFSYTGFARLTVTEAVRIQLINAALQRVGGEMHTQLACLKNYYRYGDEHEKAALLRGLSLLDCNGFAVSIAINACRVNSLTVYEAIALHNPYPARFFPELNWNQMVLKSLFQHLNISSIVALNARQNPTLSKMCLDYAREQTLANRSPPDSILLAIRIEDIAPEEKASALAYIRSISE